MSAPTAGQPPAINSPRRVLFASMAGTAIEFFDFYIYGTAAVLVFPKLFFPTGDPSAATLQSLTLFALAFFARPIGATLFGHFGDRIGRKATLVASLLTMGASTITIGLLPTYASIGLWAPGFLALCRFGQGIGLGGEWGGAVILATENAPQGKRAWYGMFPQLGAPVGFFLSGAIFLVLSETMTDRQFLAFGWRLPFLASSLLIAVGLYVRLRIAETPVFQKAVAEDRRVAVPIANLLRWNLRAVLLGALTGVAAFVLFYILTVFCLSWGTTKLGFSRNHFLIMQMVGVVLFAVGIPWSAALAEHRGRRRVMGVFYALLIPFGLALGPLLNAGPAGAWTALTVGFLIMGLSYAPLGTLLAEYFPTNVRYTGASLSFNLTGILGGSVAPVIATWLATRFGLNAVGYYLAGTALLSIAALALGPEAKREAFQA